MSSHCSRDCCHVSSAWSVAGLLRARECARLLRGPCRVAGNQDMQAGNALESDFAEFDNAAAQHRQSPSPFIVKMEGMYRDNA
jgi:hypothetical protein